MNPPPEALVKKMESQQVEAAAVAAGYRSSCQQQPVCIANGAGTHAMGAVQISSVSQKHWIAPGESGAVVVAVSIENPFAPGLNMYVCHHALNFQP